MSTPQPQLTIDRPDVCPSCGVASGLPFCPRDGALLRPFTLGARYFADRARGVGRATMVFGGHHAVLGRRVAIKILRPELAAQPAARRCFLEAAARASELTGDAILGVGDYGEDAQLGLPYVVTDFVTGSTLAEVLDAEGHLPFPQVVSALVKIARALEAAHAQSLLHLDLSPRNVHVDARGGTLDPVRVADFGLSPLREAEGQEAREAWLSRPEHLAPEQLRGEPAVGPRTDLYALGVLGYRMITGRLPFEGGSSRERIVAQLAGTPVRMPRDERATDIPNPVRRVIERCLAADPADRPESARAVAEELVGAGRNARYSEPPPAVSESLIGARIGPYRIVERIGAGGVGEVFRAEHERLRTSVAIKVLRKDVIRTGGAVERFEQEARAASAVGDPSIPAFFDFGTLPDGRPYAIMEYLRGETVAELLERNGPLGVDETKALLTQVARAMRRAHDLGIVHRDLKPENLFLMDAEVMTPSRSAIRILDFGIAKVLSPELASATHHTHVGTFMGTPDYCAPEQVYGGDVGARTDVYALGSIAFALLTGRPPFVAPSAGEVLLHKATDPAPRVSSLRAEVPPRVDEAIDRMLQRDPSSRPASMGEVLAILEGWDEPESSGIYAKRRDEEPKDAPWIPLVALVSMVVVTAAIAFGVMFSDGGAEMSGANLTNAAASPESTSDAATPPPETGDGVASEPMTP